MTSQEVQYMGLGQGQFWSQGIIKVFNILAPTDFFHAILRTIIQTVPVNWQMPNGNI